MIKTCTASQTSCSLASSSSVDLQTKKGQEQVDKDCSSHCFSSAADKQKFVQQVQRCSSSSGRAALGGLHFTTQYGFKLQNVPHGSSRPHCSQVLAGKT